MTLTDVEYGDIVIVWDLEEHWWLVLRFALALALAAAVVVLLFTRWRRRSGPNEKK